MSDSPCAVCNNKPCRCLPTVRSYRFHLVATRLASRVVWGWGTEREEPSNPPADLVEVLRTHLEAAYEMANRGLTFDEALKRVEATDG